MRKENIRWYALYALTAIYLTILFCLFSCTHKHKGKTVKTADGKFYRIEPAVAHEQYSLQEIDTAVFFELK